MATLTTYWDALNIRTTYPDKNRREILQFTKVYDVTTPIVMSASECGHTYSSCHCACSGCVYGLCAFWYPLIRRPATWFSPVIRRLHIRANSTLRTEEYEFFPLIISLLSYLQSIQLKVLMHATYCEPAALCSDEACANIIVLLLFLSSVVDQTI